MNLTDFTRPRLFHLALKAADATAAIRELAEAIGSEGLVPNTEAFCNAVLEREQLSSTDIEPGWALPHARLKGLPHPCFAVGRFATPIRWGNGGNQVRLVILLAAPD